jgi:hypothetical protein
MSFIDVHLLSAFLGIIWIDLVLAGDNAVVVGMAAAGLPRSQRTRAIVIGILAATVLRIAFATVATKLLAIIGLVIAGGILRSGCAGSCGANCASPGRRSRRRRGGQVGAVLPTADFDGSLTRPAARRAGERRSYRRQFRSSSPTCRCPWTT